MAYFSASYQIFADDVSALGPKKYLTSTQFHGALWERLLADMVLGEKPHSREEFEEVSFLFEEGYNRAVGPVSVGQRVGVLVSLEERGTGLRVYFRAIRADGDPVACGFQTVVCAARETGERIALPRSLTEFLHERSDLREPATRPSLAERVVAGGSVAELFSQEMRAVGARTASRAGEERGGASPRRTTSAFRTVPVMRASGGMRASAALRGSGAMRAGEALRRSASGRSSDMLRLSGAFPITEPARRSGAFMGPLPEFAELVVRDHGTAFVFPGLESYDGRVLRELYDYMPYLDEYFVQADEVARRRLGFPFLPLVHVATLADHDERLRRCPDLAQLGAFLTSVLLAEALQEKGVKPDVLIGYGSGELAALATGGAFDVATGLEIIAERILVLRAFPKDSGGMTAVSSSPERVRELLVALGALEVGIAAIDHPKGILLSGPVAGLAKVEQEAARQGISAARLEGVGYAFHSGALAPAADRLQAPLSELLFGAPRTQVYSPFNGFLYSSSTNFPQALSSQLVRAFDFRTAISTLRTAGCHHFVECGGEARLASILRHNVSSEHAVQLAVQSNQNLFAGLAAVGNALAPSAQSRPASATKVSIAPESTVDDSGGWPVAIVGIGCVLPGARNPDDFWRNVLEGTSSTSEPAPDDPLYRDFMALGELSPDKTYTLLSGSAGTIEYDQRLPYTREEFFALTRAQQLLALALMQCLDRPRAAWAPQSNRVACLLGATADGIREYDEALIIDSLRRYALSFDDEPAELRTAFANGLARLPDLPHVDLNVLAPFPATESVVRRFLDGKTETILIDAACASSLYAVELASKLLWNSKHDLILAGGVFSPSPAVTSLFAQFRGLATTGSYPFDERAEGLIFGEGAALLALKRLPDAIAAGDRVYGVIRGVGLSSDGKSPSVNVPQARGERLAIRRAYSRCGIDPATIQLVEAHATSAPVGDATEFQALRDEFDLRPPEAGPIQLQSVKALIGHTSWVAGAASIIKICRALEEGTFPPQHNFESPNPGIDLATSSFSISTTASAWPPNIRALPRRAAVEAFGFGGTNAHVILEAFDRTYHEQLGRRMQRMTSRSTLAVIAVGSQFAGDDGTTTTGLPVKGSGAPFKRNALSAPDQRRLLPDALSQMDVSQSLALSIAERALKDIPLWTAHRERIGVCFGLVGKTARALMATERIYHDRVQRLIDEHTAEFQLRPPDCDRLTRRLLDGMRRDNPPANPYTAVGTMPNVAAARVANMFDLNGPNMILDAGSASVLNALRQAELWLAFGDADVVLTGGLDIAGRFHPGRPAASAAAGVQGAGSEGACVLALTTQTLARANGWPVMALLAIDEPAEHAATLRAPGSDAVKRPPLDLAVTWQPHRIGGVAELALAMESAQRGRSSTIRWHVRQPAVPDDALTPARRGREHSSPEFGASNG